MSKNAIPTKIKVFLIAKFLINKIIIKMNCMAIFKKGQIFTKKLLTKKAE